MLAAPLGFLPATWSHIDVLMYLDLVSKLLLRTHAADVARAAPGLVGGGAGQGEAGPRGPVVAVTRGQSRGRAGVLIEIRVPVILHIRRELNV